MTVTTKIRKISLQEFFDMELADDATFSYELINGELVRKNAPSGKHQYAQSELFYRLMHFVTQKNMGRVFDSHTCVVLSEKSAPQPDLTFLSKEKMGLFDPEWGIKGTPDMVVEIISPSSYKRDHFQKKELYQAHGIPEYWIIDPSYRSVEIYVLQKKVYKLHAFGAENEEVKSHIIKDFSLKVDSLFFKEKTLPKIKS